MIFIKIIAIISTFLAGLIQIALEYRWHDKRTKKHKRVRSLLICFMILGVLVATISVIWDDRQSEEREQRAIDDRVKIKADLNSLQAKYDQQVLEARSFEHAATQQRKQLESQIEGLQDKLEPFVTIATNRFPGQYDEKIALSKLANELRELESRTKKIETEKERERIQSTYKRPDLRLRNQVISRLRTIIEKEKSLVISIEYEMGNQLRLRVVNDLITMIKEANIPVNRTSSQTHFRKPPPPMRAIFHPDDEQLFHNVISAFRGYLGGKITRTRKPDTPRGKIRLKFYGEPVFFTNTGVEFH